MDILGLFKRLFPKPNIPQKRYLVLLGAVIYAIAKFYVALTPTPIDDQIPDDLKNVIVHVFAYEDENGIPLAQDIHHEKAS